MRDYDDAVVECVYAYDVAGCVEVIWVGVRRIKIEAAS